MKIYCPKCGSLIDTEDDPTEIGNEPDFAFCRNESCREVISLKYDRFVKEGKTPPSKHACLKNSATDQKFWLFYAGPENYLDRNGEMDFQGEIFWSCEPETRKGDLILLYRKSINQFTVDALIRKFVMTREVAQEIKKRGVGKDISALWQAVSDSKYQSSWGWSYGCCVREIQKFNPPVSLEALKAIPTLKRWESLRWNLQAKGRSALEIPPFAWEILSEIIEKKCGIKINKQG